MIIYDDYGIGHTVVPMSVIKDIRAEIEVEKENRVYKDQFDLHFNKGLDKALEIINKHISGKD